MKVNVYLNPWYTFYFSRVLTSNDTQEKQFMNHYTAKKWIGKKFFRFIKTLKH